MTHNNNNEDVQHGREWTLQDINPQDALNGVREVMTTIYVSLRRTFAYQGHVSYARFRDEGREMTIYCRQCTATMRLSISNEKKELPSKYQSSAFSSDCSLSTHPACVVEYFNKKILQ